MPAWTLRPTQTIKPTTIRVGSSVPPTIFQRTRPITTLSMLTMIAHSMSWNASLPCEMMRAACLWQRLKSSRFCSTCGTHRTKCKSKRMSAATEIFWPMGRFFPQLAQLLEVSGSTEFEKFRGQIGRGIGTWRWLLIRRAWQAPPPDLKPWWDCQLR